MFWNFRKKQYQDFCSLNGIFSSPEIKEILSWKEDLKVENAKVGGSGHEIVGRIDHSYRMSNVRWIQPKENNDWLFERIENIITDVNNSYFHLNLMGFENIQLTEYVSSENEKNCGFYRSHIDSSNNNTRKLTIVIQLTPPCQYMGGELFLYPHNIEDPWITDKELGSVTVFRSNIIHEVKPVIEGVRDCLVAWIEGPEVY